MNHETTVITVRAPVDKLVVPVVRALLQFKEVATCHSCQGNPTGTISSGAALKWSWERDSAYAILRVGGGSIIENAVFMTFLHEHLDELRDVYVRFEMTAIDDVQPQIVMRMHQEDIDAVAGWLESIQSYWTGLAAETASRVSELNLG